MLKLTAVFCLLFIIQVNAAVFSQNVSIHLKNASLQDVFKSIEKQTAYTFLYDVNEIKHVKNLSLSFDKAPISKVLSHCFLGNELDYKIVENTVLVKAKRKSVNVAPAMHKTTSVIDFTIQGKVTSSSGKPIPGVNIAVKNTSIVTSTDANGNYSLNLTSPGTLVFSYVGHSSKEVLVEKGGTLNITMVETASDLDEVVVVGYGEQKKATVTGSVSMVSGEKLEKSPTINFTNSLAGRLPGLTSVTGGSEPGKDDSNLRIRGSNTLGNNAPLIVIDGVANRSMSRLNPSDILSVTVLKDASAAIYGAQAANGVILVTTKRGKSGKPEVELTVNQGWNSPTVIPEMADAANYAQMVNEISEYRGSPKPFSDEAIQKYKDGSDPWLYPNTDWFAETFEKSAAQRYGNMSVRGGSDNFKYFVSLGSNFQDGIYKKSATYYSQANVRSNFDVKVSEAINIGFDFAGRQENRNYPTIPATQIWATTINGLPTITAYWPNGLPGPDTQLGKSPLMATDATGYQKDKRYILESNLKLNIKIPWVKGLSLTGNASFDKNILNDKLWKTPWTLYSWDKKSYDENNQPILIGTPTGYADPSLSQSMTDGNRTSFNTLINYQTSINNSHNIKFMVGGERITSDSEFISAFRRYFVSTELDQMFAGGDLQKNNGGSASTSARLNAFGRVNYDFLNKYLVEFVWRYDGSYIFPVGKQFGFFPGVSLGWVASDEEFWKNSFAAVNYFKVRGSWGQTGNDLVGAYQYLQGYALGATASNYIFNQTTENQTLATTRIANPNITWERANQTNVGFDAEIYEGKLKVSGDYFYNLRTDILAYRNASVPATTGLSLPMENIGKVVNQGFEFQVGYGTRTESGVQYEVSVNGGYAKNKIKFWDESPGVPDYQKSTGYPMGSKLNYQAIGIFKDQAAIDAYPHMPTARPGDIIFEDVNGDGVIDGRDMKMDYRSGIPRFTGGLAIDLGYKNFYASILMQAATGAVRSVFMESEGEGFNFLMQNVEGRWTKDNPGASKPRAYNRVGEYWRANSGWNNTYYTKSNDYLRVKNIEFGYNLPSNLINKWGVEALRVYFSGQNLFTFTGLKDFDPESTFNSTTGTIYPNSKTTNFGLSLTF